MGTGDYTLRTEEIGRIRKRRTKLAEEVRGARRLDKSG